MSSDFLKLVIISILVAMRVSWYFMNQGLNDYAYRIKMGTEIFLGAAAVIITIAVGTIFTQAVKAAMANPVESLRDE